MQGRLWWSVLGPIIPSPWGKGQEPGLWALPECPGQEESQLSGRHFPLGKCCLLCCLHQFLVSLGPSWTGSLGRSFLLSTGPASATCCPLPGHLLLPHSLLGCGFSPHLLAQRYIFSSQQQPPSLASPETGPQNTVLVIFITFQGLTKPSVWSNDLSLHVSWGHPAP